MSPDLFSPYPKNYPLVSSQRSLFNSLLKSQGSPDHHHWIPQSSVQHTLISVFLFCDEVYDLQP